MSFSETRLPTLEELINHLEKNGAPFSHGGHAVYLPPHTLKQSAFRELARHYPSDAGLKILKKQGGVADSSYMLSTTPGEPKKLPQHF